MVNINAKRRPAESAPSRKRRVSFSHQSTFAFSHQSTFARPESQFEVELPFESTEGALGD
jgi:hypothetical protein